MNGLPYYKAYPRDFIEGTIGMDFEMKAAYRLVLDLIYMQGGALPDDARYISGLIGCSVKKWNGLRNRLVKAGKIEVRDGYLGNNRADKELETLGKLQDKQRENRSRPNKNNSLQTPPTNHTEPDTDNTPITPKGAVKRFDEFWESYPHRSGVKRNRKGAEAKYKSAVRSGLSEQTILDGVRKMKADPNVIRGFARDPSTWLNQRGWEDEITPQLKAVGGISAKWGKL